ncbi:hypothetical protein POUND7_008612 [Theobroma cacao]
MATAAKVKAFVEEYYRIPRDILILVFRFYKDSSKVSWLGEDGVMRNVTTMGAIYFHFLSLDAKKYDILSCYSQDSFDGGVLVLVIGCMTLKNDKTKMFKQSFFLAPQKEGFFVFNDVLMFFSDEETMNIHGGQTSDPLRTNLELISDQGIAMVPSLESNQEANWNNPKMSIIETSCYAVQNNAAYSSTVEDLDTSAFQGLNNLNRVDALEETSIFIKNLGKNTKVEELHEAFKRFGTIKPDGIYVKPAKEGRFFGFIEFESPISAQNAIQASFIKIRNRKIKIGERKRKN